MSWIQEAIKSHPKENKHFRNFQLINIGTTIGIVAYIVGRDKDEEEHDSFDEDLFFHSWAALIVSGHFARKQFEVLSNTKWVWTGGGFPIRNESVTRPVFVP